MCGVQSLPQAPAQGSGGRHGKGKRETYFLICEMGDGAQRMAGDKSHPRFPASNSPHPISVPNNHV